MTGPEGQVMNFSDKDDKIEVIRVHFFHCIVCAPKDMPVAEVALRANAVHTCGTTNGWSPCDDAYIAEHPTCGPVVCGDNPERLHHVLLA